MRWSEIVGEDVLSEMPWLNNMDKDTHRLTYHSHGTGGYSRNGTKVGEIGPYSIMQNKHAQRNKVDWWLNDDEADQPMLILRTEQWDKELFVWSLSGREGSRVKTEQLYSWLVHQGYTLVSDESQSTGASKIWQRLSRMPGIHMTVREPDGSEHDLPANWDDNYGTNSTFVARKG